MERTHTGANNWIGILIIIAIVAGSFFLISRNRQVRLPDATPTVPSISTMPLFAGGLDAVDIAGDRIGFHSFSPDGRHFFMSVFADGLTPANRAYLMRLGDGTIVSLPGTPDRALEDNRVIQLAGDGGMTLYFLDTGEAKTFDVGDTYGFGSLSPDGETYVINTQEGIRKIDVASGLVTSFTTSPYDGAYAWYPDSNRILGYRDSGENLFEAGRGRTLGIWHMDSADFIPLSVSIPDKTLRLVEWVVPGVVARVNAGWDDGSHDYLVNVDTRAVVDIGDTSGSLMGGVAVDESRGLFAVVGGDDQSAIGSNVLVYRGMERAHELVLPGGYFRQNVRIVDADRLVYLRTRWEDNRVATQELVLLTLSSGTETVLADLPPRDYAYLSVTPDGRLWVLSHEGEFMTGNL